MTQTPACGNAVSFSLNNIPSFSFASILGTKLVLFGSDLTQAKTVNAIITAKETKSGKTIDLFFKITAIDCTPAGLTATPATLTLTQLQVPATVTLSQTPAPTKCGSYTNTILPANAFIALNGSKITCGPTLATVIGDYPITVTSTMNDEPQLSSTSTITVSVGECSVTSLTAATAIPEQTYLIGGKEIEIEISSFVTQTPACEDEVSY